MFLSGRGVLSLILIFIATSKVSSPIIREFYSPGTQTEESRKVMEDRVYNELKMGFRRELPNRG